MSWVYIAPDPARDLLRPPTARELWKYQQHKIRWERRYGKPKRFFTGSIGIYENIRIIKTA